MFSSTKLLVHISHTCLEIYFLHELIFEVKCFRYIRDNEIIFLLLKNTHAHWHECQCACVFVHISARSPFPIHSCLFILLSLWLFLVKAFKTGFISIALIPKFTVGWFKLLHYIYFFFWSLLRSSFHVLCDILIYYLTSTHLEIKTIRYSNPWIFSCCQYRIWRVPEPRIYGLVSWS